MGALDLAMLTFPLAVPGSSVPVATASIQDSPAWGVQQEDG